MTIDEAIKNLKADLLRPGSVDKLDFQDAEQLGVEALKRHRDRHTLTWNGILQPLPGETSIPDLSPSADHKQRLRESPLGREPGS